MKPKIPLIILVFCFQAYGQHSLISLPERDASFEYDIQYATSNNFTGEQLYDCGHCLLQAEVAKALIAANQYFCELGYRIKLFDCYRPLDVQKRMWELAPRATYVANPYEKGSVHNRGAAVDITLVTLEGCYVDMGSDYDFFGIDSHLDNYNFPIDILAHRRILHEGMKKFGFQSVRTEWWHFSFKKMYKYPIQNEPIPCD